MARKKAQQQITIDDLIKLGPKKLILLVLAAIAAYFFGGQGFFQQQGQDDCCFWVFRHNSRPLFVPCFPIFVWIVPILYPQPQAGARNFWESS